MTLQSRLTQATAEEQGEVLREWATAFWGWDSIADGTEPNAWVARWNLFDNRLNCDAPIDAVLMLMPNAWGYSFTRQPGAEHEHVATIYPDPFAERFVQASGASVALALAGAILEAKEMGDAADA